MTRIGMNLLYLLPNIVGGTETYARGLLGALSRLKAPYDFVLFVNHETAAQLPDQFAPFARVECPVHAVHRGQRYFFEQMKLPGLLRRYGIRLVHSLGYTGPLLAPCPSVVTVHDLNFRAFGSTMPFIRRSALMFFVRGAIQRSQKIITVSEFSRNEIVRTYNVDPARIRVTHEAVLLPPLPSPSESSVDVDGHYCVAFSSMSSNKNIPRLLQAYRLVRSKGAINQKLVLIGHAPEPRPPVESDVVFTGYVTRSAMFSILRAADFLIFPSYYEGFGLPVLEAMACGVPVVCSQAASLPEIAGDAALYFDPFSVQDMAACIERIANDTSLRLRLRERGYENVKRFSWDRMATETIAVYEEVLASHEQVSGRRG